MEKEPKQYNNEEIAELEKSRTISDARLLEGDAKYIVNRESNEARLEVTKEQIESIKKEHEQEVQQQENTAEYEISPEIQREKQRLEREVICLEKKLNKIVESKKDSYMMIGKTVFTTGAVVTFSYLMAMFPAIFQSEALVSVLTFPGSFVVDNSKQIVGVFLLYSAISQYTYLFTKRKTKNDINFAKGHLLDFKRENNLKD